MLRYLIMHVRGVARGETADRSPDWRAAQGIPTRPSADASSEADELSGPQDVDARSQASSHFGPLSVRLSSPDTGTLLVLIALTWQLAGCTCFRSHSKDASIVAARQTSLKGIDALQRGKLDDAEALFSDALRQNPADERAHRHFADVMWQRGQHQAAIQHMEESARLSGGDPTLLVQLGEMYLGTGNAEAAWECATEAIEANSRLPAAWALRGDVYRRQQKWDSALESYHRALSEQPHFPHVQLAAAEVYRQQNRPQRALATLNALASQLRRQETPPAVFYQQGLAYKALGRFQDAADALTHASRQPDASADVLYHLAEAQHFAGNSASARLALQAALARAPDHQPSLHLQDAIDRQNQSMTASIKR